MTHAIKFALVVGVLFSIAALGGAFSAADDSQDGSNDAFRPIKEAELPEGFPGYTPVGTIEVKQYPAMRKAAADGSNRFWALFRHIKANNVAMTAPVEMRMGDAKAPTGREESMAFFYERADQGTPGAAGGVTVVDDEALTVVSIGCRGRRTAESVEKARRQLLEWIDARSDQYEIAGPLRVMGYNSPFVPANRQFYEVQIPVSPKTHAAKAREEAQDRTANARE